MGVNRLGVLIKSKAPDCISYREPRYYEGKRIAFDASIFIYKFVIAIRGTGKDLVTDDGKLVSHIYGIWSKILNNLKNGIESVWIFDGKPPDLKLDVIKKRKHKKNIAKEQLKTGCFKDDHEKNILTKNIFNIKRQHIRDIVRLLTLAGIPFIQSIGEAEAQCVALNKAGKIYGIASEDSDVLVLGGNSLLKDFTGKKPIKDINLQILLNELDLTHDQFIDMCIILGTDYCIGVKNMGAITAYNKFIEYDKSLEKFVDNISRNSKYIIPDNFLEKAKKIKDYYKNVNVLNPSDPAFDYEWKKPNVDGLTRFLIDELGMNRERTIENIDVIMEIYERYSHNKVLRGGKCTTNPSKYKLNLFNEDIDIDEIEENNNKTYNKAYVA